MSFLVKVRKNRRFDGVVMRKTGKVRIKGRHF